MMGLSFVLLPLFLFYVFFSDIGCSLILDTLDTPVCNVIDADFGYCYKLESDRTQYIAISPRTGCNEIFGQGRGVLGGIGTDVEWSFSGTVTDLNTADLTATIEGTGEVRINIAATQGPTGLRIQENGREQITLTPREARETCP